RLHVVKAAHAQAALDEAGIDTVLLLPIGGERHAAEMAARGMAADKEPIRIAAEALGILVDPGDGALHLLGHHADIAIGAARLDEIEHDEGGAGIVEQLGGVAIFLGLAVEPGAAMDEDEDR